MLPRCSFSRTVLRFPFYISSPCVSNYVDSIFLTSMILYFRFASSKSGKIFLHTDIRVLFARDKFEFDPSVAKYELRSFTEVPSNPKFSPRRWRGPILGQRSYVCENACLINNDWCECTCSRWKWFTHVLACDYTCDNLKLSYCEKILRWSVDASDYVLNYVMSWVRIWFTLYEMII